MTQQFGGELAKHPLLRLTGPQARPSSLWAGEGRPPGLRAEQTRRIWLKVPRERRKWCKPTPRVLAEFRGPPLALRVSPSSFRAASQSRSLSAWVRSLVSHATRPQLHSNLAGAKLDPRAQERDGPRALRAQKAPFPSSLSSAERWEPPAVTPPRRGERTEPARTPADELAAPSIARCGSGQVSLRPPTALPHSPASQGSPAGSGFARLLPAPPEGTSSVRCSGLGSPLDCGRWRCEERVARPGPGSSRGVPPIRCFPCPARGGLFSRKRQFSLPFASAQYCPAWRWRHTGTEAALFLEC